MEKEILFGHLLADGSTRNSRETVPLKLTTTHMSGISLIVEWRRDKSDNNWHEKLS